MWTVWMCGGTLPHSLAEVMYARVKTHPSHNDMVMKCYSESPVNLSDPAIQRYLKTLIIEHENLSIKGKRTLDETRRLLEIKPVVSVLEQRIALYENIESLKDLNQRPDQDTIMKKMIKEEAELYLKRIKEVDGELTSILLEPQLTEGSVMLEVTAGAGGQEAMLFARELFDMYEKYATYKDWDVTVASVEKSDLGGVRKALMFIEGFGVPELMKVEAGVHRVQRIPTTEKGGRVHTSTVSVAVLPQPADIDVEIAERDLVIETKRASGAGGQHVNTTDSAVRITHTPTGTVVDCQEGRSQIKNKEIAMQKLRTLLLEKQFKAQAEKINSERKSQVGSSNRNEKIRTYNYPQDRVTEHREAGLSTHNLQNFMEGSEDLEKMQETLIRQQKQQAFLNEIEEYVKKYKIEKDN
ncbi:unnamed protein product [Chrysodeixis includens]|uniref:Prokaryotic-type class I peptide chain release factors domain-containing protein n=1 Tax=Chrysodeixis includens TaxID=689277 RepID=A0A9N8KPM9_CHRIL|nr:unnamed protein product [Chrysodeixis includens]